jgi:hypothetical protein
VLARLFVLERASTSSRRAAAGVPESWLVPDGFDVAAAVRLQPVPARRASRCWSRTTRPARGRGAPRAGARASGAASLTLAAATPRRSSAGTLDLGTGSGIQALLAEDHSGSVVATDASARRPRTRGCRRAERPAAATCAPGTCSSRCAGELFDLVGQQPAVRHRPGSGYTYRDGGRDGRRPVPLAGRGPAAAPHR